MNHEPPPPPNEPEAVTPATKRPWSKPTISVLHRLVRTHTGTSTLFTTEPESVTYLAQS